MKNQIEPDEEQPDVLALLGAAFGRCANYPRDTTGAIGLAQGLKKASDRFAIPVAEIIAACAAASAYCPTDHDLLTIAAELRGAKRPPAEIQLEIDGRKVSKQEWERHHGQPKAFAWLTVDWDGVKVRKDREAKMFREIRVKLGAKWGKSDWHEMAAAARELGYPDYAKAWRGGA